MSIKVPVTKQTTCCKISNVFLTTSNYIIEALAEIDTKIEESTSLIFEDDLEKAQVSIQSGIKKLNVHIHELTI